MPLNNKRPEGPARRDDRRYPIYRDAFVACTLVYEGDGAWCVEKAGTGGEQVRVTLREFEESETGKRLKLELSLAIAQAQDDL